MHFDFCKCKSLLSGSFWTHSQLSAFWGGQFSNSKRSVRLKRVVVTLYAIVADCLVFSFSRSSRNWQIAIEPAIFENYIFACIGLDYGGAYVSIYIYMSRVGTCHSSANALHTCMPRLNSSALEHNKQLRWTVEQKIHSSQYARVTNEQHGSVIECCVGHGIAFNPYTMSVQMLLHCIALHKPFGWMSMNCQLFFCILQSIDRIYHNRWDHFWDRQWRCWVCA